jgi:RHH-type proline utilization regulon transcriptional repressor/proline dehydrogenase/delta 1-pyrroline-5-carboxylate dehydrogenase
MFARLEDAARLEGVKYEGSDMGGNFPFFYGSDLSNLRCESNAFRYRQCRGVILRLEKDDLTIRARAESECIFYGLMLSGFDNAVARPDLPRPERLPLHVSLATQETEAQLIARLPELAREAEFLRTITPPGDALLAAAYDAGLNWIDAPLLENRRIEMTRWMREQSVSKTQHRYGLVQDPPSK